MSTKTTFKRIALVTVAALGFGMVSTVTPASAIANSLVASVGPAGQTSLTVVGGDTSTTGALVRLDVVSNDTATPGLAANESITASVTGVPTSVTAKTLAANGGSLADSTTALGGTGVNARADFIILETTGQATGSLGTAAADAISRPTNWSKMAVAAASGLNLDSATYTASQASDGVVGSLNSYGVNMDSIHELTSTNYTRSYYVTIRPRTGANVIDQGANTFSFQLTDANGVVLEPRL